MFFLADVMCESASFLNLSCFSLQSEEPCPHYPLEKKKPVVQKRLYVSFAFLQSGGCVWICRFPSKSSVKGNGGKIKSPAKKVKKRARRRKNSRRAVTGGLFTCDLARSILYSLYLMNASVNPAAFSFWSMASAFAFYFCHSTYMAITVSPICHLKMKKKKS
ncbi:MAG: hypothetical protein RR859_09680, partial [Ruthenibacterium sp.]